MEIEKIISDFPILQTTDKKGRRLCYLDSASTTQKPLSVIEKMNEYYRTENANVRRGVYKIAEKATEDNENARAKIAKFIHAKSASEIVFTRNSTESINLVAYTWGRKNLHKGDVVILTEAEHHSNLVPWQILSAEKGIDLEFIPVKEDYFLDLDKYAKLLEKKPKLVSCTGMSNVLGIIPPIKEMIRQAHDAGAIFLVDGAQMVPHMKVDVQELDADFLAFSGHKMLGPTGSGVLFGKEKLLEEMPPFMGGGEMISKVFLRSFTTDEVPYKFEAGTPAIAEAIGLGAAIDYLNLIGMDQIEAWEKEITTYAITQLQQVPGLKLFGPANGKRGGAISFTFDYVHPHDVSQILDSENICVRAGHHCAMPLHDKFGLSASTRASIYLYNTKEDIDRLVHGLGTVNKYFA